MARKKKTAADLHYEQQRKAHEAAMWSAMDARCWAQDSVDWAVYSAESNAEIRRRELNGE
ncbi:hypothetical protein D2T81_07395 [Azospirillum brasilense]|nr:hypothetical protein D2T81_07395 [Azospirillum brasilense]